MVNEEFLKVRVCTSASANLWSGVLFALVIVTGMVSCGNHDVTAENLEFEVVDSLLGAPVPIESAGIVFKPPVGFEPVEDSLKGVLVDAFTGLMPAESNIDLAEILFSEEYSSAVIVAKVSDLHLQSDTAEFASEYRRSLAETYGESNVQVGDFWANDVYVKNHLIQDSMAVHFNLICLSDGRDAVELQYIIARPHYAKILKSLESSMGSINLIHQGGE